MYEIHVTVEGADEEGFTRLCESQKARAILIELPETAAHPRQMMCSKWTVGTLENALRVAREFSQAARRQGYAPVREKVEQAFSSCPDDFVPRKALGEYWEFHYKLHLPPPPGGRGPGEALQGDPLTGAEGLALALQGDPLWGVTARLSRSALRDRAPDGGLYRIVTLRLYTGSKGEAAALSRQLGDWLTQRGFNVTKVQREVSVHDNHVSLDDGWL